MAGWKTGAKHSSTTITIQKVYASVSRVLAGESRTHCPHTHAPYEEVPHMPLPLSGLWHQGPKTSLPFCPLGHLFGGRMGGVSVRPIPSTSPCPCSHIRGSCDTPSCPTSDAHSALSPRFQSRGCPWACRGLWQCCHCPALSQNPVPKAV